MVRYRHQFKIHTQMSDEQTSFLPNEHYYDSDHLDFEETDSIDADWEDEDNSQKVAADSQSQKAEIDAHENGKAPKLKHEPIEVAYETDNEEDEEVTGPVISRFLCIDRLGQPFPKHKLLRMLTRAFGPVDELHLHRARYRAFVAFATERDARCCCKELHGSRWPTGSSQSLTVKFYTEQQYHRAKEFLLPLAESSEGDEDDNALSKYTNSYSWHELLSIMYRTSKCEHVTVDDEAQLRAHHLWRNPDGCACPSRGFSPKSPSGPQSPSHYLHLRGQKRSLPSGLLKITAADAPPAKALLCHSEPPPSPVVVPTVNTDSFRKTLTKPEVFWKPRVSPKLESTVSEEVTKPVSKPNYEAPISRRIVVRKSVLRVEGLVPEVRSERKEKFAPEKKKRNHEERTKAPPQQHHSRDRRDVKRNRQIVPNRKKVSKEARKHGNRSYRRSN